MNNVTIHKVSRLKGVITPPGDKSVSHRAVIMGAIGDGETIVRNILDSEDVGRTIEIFKELGVRIEKRGDLTVIRGRGLNGLKRSEKILYCGNSGTTMRLLTGLLAAQPFESRLTGDESLNRRPMGRIIEPIRKMGGNISEVIENNTRIIKVLGKRLKGIHYVSPVASAQVKTAVLLAGLYADGKTSFEEPVKSRDHTERIFRHFGIPLKEKGLPCGGQGTGVIISQAIPFKGCEVSVPGDFSSAAFFIVAGLINQNSTSEVKIKGVGLNPLRTGLLDVLEKMGGRIERLNLKEVSGEPVGDLIVRPSRLKGITVEAGTLPSMIDEVPILAVVASLADGKTIIKDASELRVKETDRLEAISTQLGKLGANISIRGDDLEITGVKSLTGGDVKSLGDHRIAMALAIAGTVCTSEVKIGDVDCVNTSYPKFFNVLGTP